MYLLPAQDRLEKVLHWMERLILYDILLNFSEEDTREMPHPQYLQTETDFCNTCFLFYSEAVQVWNLNGSYSPFEMSKAYIQEKQN